MTLAPILLWLRRDLRLADHEALCAALARAVPVIPLFIRDGQVDSLGAASKQRLGLGLAELDRALRARGSKLVLRSGDAEATLRGVVAETGAQAVHWTRMYDPDAVARDTRVKASLGRQGIEANSYPGSVLFEPWTVATAQGDPYRVFTPFWRAVRGRDPGSPLTTPSAIPGPERWPASETLASWRLDAAMGRGAGVLEKHLHPGEAAAQNLLSRFIAEKIGAYASERDFPAASATSGLSEPLAHGEISPRQVWTAGVRALEAGVSGAEAFLRELGWREFAYHLMYHMPRMLTANWREDWDHFPWRTDADAPEVQAWTQGRTGEPFVDAAMRELWVTGRMHNRTRMVVASYLTKHLLVDWRIGRDVFARMLADWDPAANALGWQWVAGSGPDAAPYFRVFNPATQAAKFDPDGAYRDAWIAEGRADPPETALDYFDAVPRSWGLSPEARYPDPVVELTAGRARALAAYDAFRTGRQHPAGGGPRSGDNHLHGSEPPR